MATSILHSFDNISTKIPKAVVFFLQSFNGNWHDLIELNKRFNTELNLACPQCRNF